MERVCEELEEAKAEIEKLREEIKTKARLSETLKRTHNEQLTKIQEANAKVEKQARELNEKEDEIVATKQKYEEIKSIVKEKESLIKHLSSTNDKLRITSDERLIKWEDEKNEILEKLVEANSKNLEKEQDLVTYKEEIKGLKALLSAFENKCLEAEKNAKASKESGRRDDMFFKLEDESIKLEEQLKWKKEQFKHLEEAHKKLRDEFKSSEKQWEMEKSTLLDEMYKLQDKLDSQTRISQDLQSRLQICHQALAHEESRRKVLEVQFSEMKLHLDSAVTDCEEAKMETGVLTSQRDEEIARMRDLLGKKEMAYKEMQYRFGRLEQENEELRISIKEFQEAGIKEKGASSPLSKLHNKLKRLEQAHKDCSKNLIAKETEWASILEKMNENLHNCKYELEQKTEIIKELEFNCERLDQIHRNCSENLRAKEVEWASHIEKVVEALTNCKSELEGKNKAIKELEIKFEGLDQAHRDCALKFRSEEARWIAQLDNMAEDLINCKNELKGKDEAIKELQMKCELSDQVHQDCSRILSLKEAEWTLHSEKLVEELGECRAKLENKDEVMKELRVKMEVLEQLYRDCSESLKAKEAESKELARELSDCQYDLNCKNEDINQLKAELKVLKQINGDLSAKVRAKEAELGSQIERTAEGLDELRLEIEGKDEVMKELRVKMEILEQLYRDCSESLKGKEVESEELARGLIDCQYELNCKNDDVKQLKAELEVLKQINGDLSSKIRAKEAELDLQLERTAEDLDELRLQIEGKDEVMKELQIAFENSNSSNMLLELQNEEKSLMIIVFKSVISDMNLNIREREKEVSLLMKQLQVRNEAIVRAQTHIEENNENIASLSSRIECLSHLKDELEHELAEKLCEENEHEFELNVWRSIAERSNADLAELKKLRKDLEASLLRQIEVEDCLKHENENLINIIEEKDKLVKCLEQELKDRESKSGNDKEKAFYESHEKIERLEQEWLSRELEGVILAHMNTERVIEQEKEDFSRKIGKKQEELNLLLKSWEKIATDELAKEIEIQEKTLVISELEGDLEILQRKFDFQQKEVKELAIENKELKSSFRNLEISNEKLDSEKESLLSERERMLSFIGSLSERISSLSVEDMKLASFWEKIVHSCANEEDDELYDPSKENTDINSHLIKKCIEATDDDGRSPLRALNKF